MPKKQKSRIWQLLEWFLLAAFATVLASAFIDRAGYANHVFGSNINCLDCLTWPVFLHDIAYLCGLFALLVLSFHCRRFYLHVILRLLAILGIVLYIADVVVMDQFFTRLKLSDVRIYGDQLPLLWRHIESTGLFASHTWLLPVIATGVALLLLVPPSGAISRRITALLLLIPAAGALSGTLISPPSYVHDWALRNLVSANFNAGVTQPFSDSYRQQLLAAPEPQPVCRDGQGDRPDIVLLILESWSPFQSRLLSGINDWTPRLDQLARANTWYSHFHAGGYTTNEGLISLLTGLEYIAPVKTFFHLMPFETAWETGHSAPEILKQTGGYHSAFLTSGNLNFTSKGKWLNSLDFDHVEGHDYPGYKGLQRRHFDSVADEFLYQRGLDYLQQRAAEPDPSFVVIETVSTHHPYIDPVTDERSAEAVFRYMDETTHDFYLALEQDGFFENGMLIIVSDHRAMVPIDGNEAAILGQAAASLIPAIVIGGPTARGEITEAFHQSDLVASLAALTGEQHCAAGPYRNLFDPGATEPRCLYHARGDDRDHLDVFCPAGSAVVSLRGDDTRLIKSKGIRGKQKSRIIDEVNQFRVRGDERTRRLIEAGYFD
ncbi:MAG: sulfatase-like hydrolase/transferase [Porticoccaceae bacterium]